MLLAKLQLIINSKTRDCTHALSRVFALIVIVLILVLVSIIIVILNAPTLTTIIVWAVIISQNITLKQIQNFRILR